VCLSLSSEGQCSGVIGFWESWRSAIDVHCRLKLFLDTPAKNEVVLHPSFIIFYNLYLHQLPFGACCVASFANLIKWALCATMLMHFCQYYNRRSHLVDQIPSLEADRLSANQELSYFLRKQKIHKISPPDQSWPRQMHVTTSHPPSSQHILNYSSVLDCVS